MKIRRSRNILWTMVLLVGALVGLFAVLTIAEARMKVMEIPPVPPQIQADVVGYEFDLLKVSSNWPKSLTVENISDKEVSGFIINIWAANDDGGPGELIGWGQDPNYGKQTPLFKPKEVMTLPIAPRIVTTFERNGKPFLYIAQWKAWVNNDPQYLYAEGALLQQDPNNPNVYTVIRDNKGRDKRQRQHHHALPHITHSIQPPFPLRCCNREFYQSVTFDCQVSDPCNSSKKCQNTNYSYTVCSVCCGNYQVTETLSCYSLACPGLLCDQSMSITHNAPCTCCNC